MEQTPDQKFNKDGPFNDPVVMCDSCQKLILTETLHKTGMCPSCSNTRVRNIRSLSVDSGIQLERWASEGKIDPDFIKLFEWVDPEAKT